MLFRRFFVALSLVGALVQLTSCTSSPGLSSIVISPAAPTVGLALNSDGTLAPPSAQIPTNYQAIGYYTHPGHPPIMKDLTNQVTWYTDVPDLVTISSTGVATPAVKAIGNCQILASMQGFNGIIVSNASNYTVTVPSNFQTSDVTSLLIQPGYPSITAAVGTKEGFAAIGTTGTGATPDVTASSVWSSSNTSVFQLNGSSATGKVTGAGQTAILATYTNPDGLQVTAYTIMTVTAP